MTTSAAELAAMGDAELQAEYDRLMAAWMARRDDGQRHTWRQFKQIDGFDREMERRKYGPTAAAAERCPDESEKGIL